MIRSPTSSMPHIVPVVCSIISMHQRITPIVCCKTDAPCVGGDALGRSPRQRSSVVEEGVGARSGHPRGLELVEPEAG